jgi:hypothetical protein
MSAADEGDYENYSKQLIDNIPYTSIDFDVAALPADTDGTIIVQVGLKDLTVTGEFENWRSQFTYPENTKFIFYTKP